MVDIFGILEIVKGLLVNSKVVICGLMIFLHVSFLEAFEKAFFSLSLHVCREYTISLVFHFCVFHASSSLCKTKPQPHHSPFLDLSTSFLLQFQPPKRFQSASKLEKLPAHSKQPLGTHLANFLLNSDPFFGRLFELI